MEGLMQDLSYLGAIALAVVSFTGTWIWAHHGGSGAHFSMTQDFTEAKITWETKRQWAKAHPEAKEKVEVG